MTVSTKEAQSVLELVNQKEDEKDTVSSWDTAERPSSDQVQILHSHSPEKDATGTVSSWNTADEKIISGTGSGLDEDNNYQRSESLTAAFQSSSGEENQTMEDTDEGTEMSSLTRKIPIQISKKAI